MGCHFLCILYFLLIIDISMSLGTHDFFINVLVFSDMSIYCPFVVIFWCLAILLLCILYRKIFYENIHHSLSALNHRSRKFVLILVLECEYVNNQVDWWCLLV